MNIRIRAALEVAGFTAIAVACGFIMGQILNLIEQNFGMQGVLILLGSIVGGALLNMMYQIRVSHLRLMEKLKK